MLYFLSLLGFGKLSGHLFRPLVSLRPYIKQASQWRELDKNCLLDGPWKFRQHSKLRFQASLPLILRKPKHHDKASPPARSCSRLKLLPNRPGGSWQIDYTGPLISSRKFHQILTAVDPLGLA